MTTAYKVLTHDLRPPMQGGDPVLPAGYVLPFALPAVAYDHSEVECAPGGWYACREANVALRIAGLWPNGRSSRLFEVGEPFDLVERGDKLRAASWTVTREVPEDEIAAHVRRLSEPFAPFADEMTVEQMAWRAALARPGYAPEHVEAALTKALTARGLAWKLKRYDTAWDARASWDARDAWAARAAWAARDAWAARAAWAARDAWDARAAWDARPAWAARAAWAARDARAAWDARAARAAWAAWDAWDAWDALVVDFAARQKWITHPGDLLTVGIRDAYSRGLEIAIPTEPDVLGWAMREP